MINELFLYRKPSTLKDTPGILVYNNEIICQTIEDIDRELYDTMTRKEIVEKKIYGVTAIPYGRYEMKWFDSPKHGWCLMLIGVPGFSYVQVHVANYATQLLGCIGVGTNAVTNAVEHSKTALKIVNDLVKKNSIKFINIEKMK